MREISRSRLALAILVVAMMASILMIFIGQIVKSSAKAGDPAAAVALCNPVGNDCAAHINGLNIMLNLGDEVRSLKTFPVRVTLEGADGSTFGGVIVEFSMSGMDMGINRRGLILGEDGIWHGQAILPVCGSGRLSWQAKVQVIGERQYAGEFAFEASPP